MTIKDDKQYFNAVNKKRALEKKSALVREATRLQSALQVYDNKRALESQLQQELVPQPVLSFTEKTIQERIEKITELLLVKGKEYVRGNDRLHNFRRTAESQRITMPEALHGFLMKHITSYFDMIDDIKSGKEISEKVIDEKIADIMVYFLLQEAVIKTHNFEKFGTPKETTNT